MKLLYIILGLAASSALASPVSSEEEKRQFGSTAPSVTIKNGTVVGSNSNGVDSFLGIPFALPPTGQLRLRQPQTYNKNFGTLQATQYAPGCIQVIGGASPTPSLLPSAALSALANNPITAPLVNGNSSSSSSSEDCLYLNVQRPAGTKAGAKLPVVVWIYGGAFQFGSTSMYNANNIVARGNTLKAPFVYVSMAYRLSGFGWMPGKEMQADGSSNIGLHDQRKALQWVAENIAAFGGDPDHVVIWGESAGAISVFDHIIINNGDNSYAGRPLFHGAIMNSGSIVPTRDINSTKAQGTYDRVVGNAGCSGARDTLACLRSRPVDNFTAALDEIPAFFGYQSVNLPFLPRPDPSNGFFTQSPEVAGLGGQFAHVPTIIGDQEDEGTIFSLAQNNLTTNDQLIDYFSQNFFPGTPRATVAQLINAYPQDVSQGSPFRTGVLNNIYPQYKRLAAILGDITFNLIRRALLSYASSQVPSWSYLNSYLYGTPVLGTLHGADLVYLYGPLATTTFQNPQMPIDYYISFFTYYDPNKLAAINKVSWVNWPQWKNDTRQLLNFASGNTNVITDNFRQAQYAALLSEQGKLRA